MPHAPRTTGTKLALPPVERNSAARTSRAFAEAKGDHPIGERSHGRNRGVVRIEDRHTAGNQALNELGLGASYSFGPVVTAGVRGADH